MSDCSDVESDVGGDETDNILYDIVTYREWEQEPELQRSGADKKVTSRQSWWRGSNGQGSVPAEVEKLRSVGLPWKLTVSSDADLIAVLGELYWSILRFLIG